MDSLHGGENEIPGDEARPQGESEQGVGEGQASTGFPVESNEMARIPTGPPVAAGTPVAVSQSAPAPPTEDPGNGEGCRPRRITFSQTEASDASRPAGPTSSRKSSWAPNLSTSTSNRQPGEILAREPSCRSGHLMDAPRKRAG